MFCNFCGKNFDSSEGFEEITRNAHHYVRCEKCAYNQAEEQYDWHLQMYGRGHQPGAGGGRQNRPADKSRKGI